LPAPEKLSENIYYHTVRVSGGYRRTLFTEAVQKTRAVIRRIDPDIAHGQGTEDYPGVCAAFSGYPNCITIHGNMREVVRKIKYRPFPATMFTAMAESIALKKTDAVICNSAYTEQCVGKLNKNKVRIPNAVRSSFFELGSNIAEESARPILLCIGDILPYKNQIGLMKALDSLPNIANMTLLFAGRCDSCSAYGRKFLKMVDARMWCQYAGYLPLSELQKRMAGCAGVVHPTLEDSFGLAVAEAQAAGVPVAASAIGGITDLMKDGETGFLFDPSTPETIRSAVSNLLDSKESVCVAERGRRFANKTYRPADIVEQHLQAYVAILKQKTRTKRRRAS
jgi:L-malate glycosyltransferase